VKKPKTFAMKSFVQPCTNFWYGRCFIILFIFSIPEFSYSQTFFGVSSTPADNGTQVGPTVAVTPPGSMVAGDLVVVYAHYRATGATLSISATGGQTWNTATTNNASTQTFSIFWCRYNGTWGANPSVTLGAGTNAMSVIMYVYRPVNSNSIWAVNIAATNSSSSSTTNTITGITTIAPNTVTMAFWGNAAANTWGTLAGTGWSKTGLSAQYRNTSTSGQSHTAAYTINTTAGAIANVSQNQSAGTTTLRSIIAWHELNDLCTGAPVLTSGTTCTNTAGTLQNATVSSPAVTTACATAGGDVWYQFTAQTAYPVITISSIVTGTNANPRIQLLHGSCGSLTSDGCVSGSSVTSLALDTRTTVGGAGLTVGTTYYVRIYSNTLAPTGSNWNFDICITNPSPGSYDHSKSYINLSKRTTGGTVDPGDSLEIRATFVVFSGNADSLSFTDTIYKNRGFTLGGVIDSITTRTNEGKNHKFFTESNGDADAGWRTSFGANPDTAIQINFGSGGSRTVRGELRNSSKPSVFGGTCIIMCTYRVKVNAAYGTKIRFGGGAITYRDSATGVLNTVNFRNDSLIVYQSPGLCPNSVSVTNAVGVETNGTFGVPSTGAPLARNRSTSSYVPGYIYNAFSVAGGPQDYYYGIANNTSANFTITQNYAKPDLSGTAYRVFGQWDIIGDHTGATNTAKGNSPCDTTKVVSASNPCGYMLIINSAYKTDTAFQYTVSNLCPNTYYEISGWLRNICYKCSCDSNGKGASDASGPPYYIPFAPGDSSGVQPNLAFDVDGTDYYTTGNIPYYGTTPTKSDTSNRWVKRGFTYLTGTTQTSFTLTIRNNAPGGGGNDWAIDDISVATCLPDMRYSPSLNPAVCTLNVITLYDTVRSYFNNYANYKWQRSTDGGVTWNDVAGATGTATPVWNGSAYQYIVSYTLSPTYTQVANNGDRYRLVIATTTANLSNSNCIVTDGQIINLNVLSCPWALATGMLSFNGKLQNEHATLSWITSREDEAVDYTIEKSIDGINYTGIGTVSSYFNNAETNRYSFVDPSLAGKLNWYRIAITNNSGNKKYSSIILLNKDQNEFDLTNVINPFFNELPFNVYLNNNTTIEARIIDFVGKIVKTKTFIVYSGTSSLSIETNSLAPGIYTFQLQHGETIISRKVMKR
jgi:hypothetical protein